MSAQLELPEEFTLPASAGEQGKELYFRRDYELGGVTHRARIGPLISTVILTSPNAAEKPSPQGSSTRPTMDESEEEMSLPNNEGTSLRGELFRRTLPFALFLVLALVAISVDHLSPFWRAILVVAGILLIALTFFLWFPRDQEPRQKTDFRRQKL